MINSYKSVFVRVNGNKNEIRQKIFICLMQTVCVRNKLNLARKKCHKCLAVARDYLPSSLRPEAVDEPTHIIHALLLGPKIQQ